MSTPKEWYDVASKYYLIIPILLAPPTFLHDAPFGRFSPSTPSRLLVDGINSWILMEIVSPLCFLLSFLSSPLTRPINLLKSSPFSPPPMLSTVQFATLSVSLPNAPTLLAALFLGHYLNRALLSPLRTPVRSKSHISVPLLGIIFNVVNGSLMGAFLAAVAVPPGTPGSTWDNLSLLSASWKFWAGVGMWALGFTSNIWHDEILLNLRRERTVVASQKSEGKQHDKKPHYAIPYGGLYALISYPNYFSEWFEWLGYAIAASALTSQLPSTHVVFPFAAGSSGLGSLSSLSCISQLTPAWLFLSAEVFLMFPRAWKGHNWYHKTFPDYPRQRKAAVPFLL